MRVCCLLCLYYFLFAAFHLLLQLNLLVSCNHSAIGLPSLPHFQPHAFSPRSSLSCVVLQFKLFYPFASIFTHLSFSFYYSACFALTHNWVHRLFVWPHHHRFSYRSYYSHIVYIVIVSYS